jgi:hypothetical protein
LQGELLDGSGAKIPELILEGTKYLPALAGRQWYSSELERSLTDAQRLDIKRSKIDVKIIKRDSSPEAKYDLFHRLNSYGTALTSQELRSSLLVSISPVFFDRLERLATYPSFSETIMLSERLSEERFDLELVTRFLVLHNWPAKQLNLSALRDVPQVLDDGAVALASKPVPVIAELEAVFKTVFDTVAANGGEEVFRRWDADKQEFKGSFLNSAFEIFALGLGYHIANGQPCRTDLIHVVKEVWSRPEMKKGFATGRSTEARLIQFIPLGREVTAA